jgi:CheY-like chemotaxis protein
VNAASGETTVDRVGGEGAVTRSPFVRSERLVILGGTDAALRGALGASIRADGCDVVEVSDGVLLLGQVEFLRSALGPRSGVVVVMTDMGLTGLEVLGILRRIYREIPVMFVTASGSERIMRRARSLGAREVFAAPVDVEVLKGAIRAAMPR